MQLREWAQTLMLGSLLLLAGCKKAETPQTPIQVVKVEAVSEVAINEARPHYAGILQPYSQINMNFENQAYVNEVMMVPKNGGTVLVDAGDVLNAGTVLGRQDASEFEARAEQANANVQQAKAQLAESKSKLTQALAQQQQAYANLTQAEANYQSSLDKLNGAHAQRRQAVAGLGKAAAQRTETRKSFERANVLYHEEAMTKPDWDRTTADYEMAVSSVAASRAQINEATAQIGSAEEAVRSSQAGVKSAQAQVTSAQAQVASAQEQIDAAEANLAGANANYARAKIALAHCSLVVPTDSVLVSRSVSPGSLAGPSATAFVVADIRRMKAVFGVPDTEVTQLKVGQDMRVSFEAFPTDPVVGRITSIAPSSDQKGRVFDVSVMIPNAERKYKNGMIVNLEMMQRGQKRNVLSVPLVALTRSPRNMDAYAVVVATEQGGKTVVNFRDVKIGKALGNLVEITQGLAVGDKVVVGGNNVVHEGEVVQVEQK